MREFNDLIQKLIISTFIYMLKSRFKFSQVLINKDRNAVTQEYS